MTALRFALLGVLALAASAARAAEASIRWLIEFDGKTPPHTQGWNPVGELAAKAQLADGALRIVDDSATQLGGFRAAWSPEPAMEIVVEARIRVEAMKSDRGGTSLWPLSDGVPAGLIVSDGRREGGLVLRPDKIASLVDRVALMDARSAFHTYRLIIRGNDMAIEVDGQRRIKGEGAFARPAATPEAYVLFGSSSKTATGDSYWSSVRLGIRPAAQPPKPRLRVTLSEPWDIPPLHQGTGTSSIGT